MCLHAFAWRAPSCWQVRQFGMQLPARRPPARVAVLRQPRHPAACALPPACQAGTVRCRTRQGRREWLQMGSSPALQKLSRPCWHWMSSCRCWCEQSPGRFSQPTWTCWAWQTVRRHASPPAAVGGVLRCTCCFGLACAGPPSDSDYSPPTAWPSLPCRPPARPQGPAAAAGVRAAGSQPAAIWIAPPRILQASSGGRCARAFLRV